MSHHLKKVLTINFIATMETKEVMTELTKEELIGTFGGNVQQGYVLIRVGNKLIWVKSSTSSV